jgi:hypothetical protein
MHKEGACDLPGLGQTLSAIGRLDLVMLVAGVGVGYWRSAACGTGASELITRLGLAPIARRGV